MWLLLLIPAFLWLGYETNWMTVRLLVGDLPQRELKFEPTYCRNRSGLSSWRPHSNGISYKIPARTLHLYGHTQHLYEGCNRCRAQVLKALADTMKSERKPHYHKQSTGYNYPQGEIELLKDGKHITTINSEYKRGMIRQAMKA